MQIAYQSVENSAEILHRIRELVASDMTAIDHLIQAELVSNVHLTQEITHHIFQVKGKRLRPLLMMLAARALFGQMNMGALQYALAVVIEFVHTATLLHDDVVDQSSLRRGQRTANTIWGNPASVLVGDFLYSRAFQILARHQQPTIMQVLSETTNAIAEGEIMQLMHQHSDTLSQENYFHVITQKTARLFSTAAEIGAILSDANESDQQAMKTYGLHLGVTFQLIDDLLDYETSSTITGKNIGDDLAEGKITLPLIYAIENTTAKKAAFIRNAVQQGNIDALSEVLLILKETNAFAATRHKAKEEADLALQALSTISPSVYRQALEELVTFAAGRSY